MSHFGQSTARPESDDYASPSDDYRMIPSASVRPWHGAFGGLRNAVEHLPHFVVDIGRSDERGERMIVGLAHQIRQVKLVEELLEQRVEEIVARLDVWVPGRRFAKGGQRGLDLANRIRHRMSPPLSEELPVLISALRLGVGEEGFFLTQVVLEFTPPPSCLREIGVGRQRLLQPVVDGQAYQVSLRFPQPVEVLLCLSRLVRYVMDEWALKCGLGGVIQAPGQGSEYGEIGRPFQIEYPAHLLRLIVVLEADLLQRLQHLGATVIDAVRFADEGDDHVSIGGLVENDLRMTGCEYLAAGLRRRLGQHLVYLTLPQDLQVRIGLIE